MLPLALTALSMVATEVRKRCPPTSRQTLLSQSCPAASTRGSAMLSQATQPGEAGNSGTIGDVLNDSNCLSNKEGLSDWVSGGGGRVNESVPGARMIIESPDTAPSRSTVEPRSLADRVTGGPGAAQRCQADRSRAGIIGGARDRREQLRVDSDGRRRARSPG
eukprot:758101-Hanusia_phi.AAC.1